VANGRLVSMHFYKVKCIGRQVIQVFNEGPQRVLDNALFCIYYGSFTVFYVFSFFQSLHQIPCGVFAFADANGINGTALFDAFFFEKGRPRSADGNKNAGAAFSGFCRKIFGFRP
jgi:hypothetical protein